MGLNETDTFFVLKPKSEWRGNKDDIIVALRAVLEGFPGLVYGFTQPIEMRVSEMLTGTRGDVAIKIFGSDLGRLNEAAHQIADAVRAVPGAAEVIAPKAEGLQYLSVRLNRTTMGQAGFSVEALQQAFKNQVEGESLGYVLQDGVRTPLTSKAMRPRVRVQKHSKIYSSQRQMDALGPPMHWQTSAWLTAPSVSTMSKVCASPAFKCRSTAVI
jgi:Cu/Ag efflux pump CusA